MQESSIIHNTFVLERSYPKPPRAVFAAFADKDKKRRWYAERESHELQEFELDFRIGGLERFAYRLKAGTPVAGMTITNESRYEDIVPAQRIVTSATMDLSEKRILISLLTVEFLPTDSGTDLILTNQGIYLQGANGLTPQMIEAGWNALLDKLNIEMTR